MYTSGTTSLPKGVMLRFRDFTAYVTANVEMADGTERGAVTGVRAVLPYRRHYRDDDQPVDRAQMVVMPQFDPKPGSNWSSANMSRMPSSCPP